VYKIISDEQLTSVPDLPATIFLSDDIKTGHQIEFKAAYEILLYKVFKFNTIRTIFAGINTAISVKKC